MSSENFIIYCLFRPSVRSSYYPSLNEVLYEEEEEEVKIEKEREAPRIPFSFRHNIIINLAGEPYHSLGILRIPAGMPWVFLV